MSDRWLDITVAQTQHATSPSRVSNVTIRGTRRAVNTAKYATFCRYFVDFAIDEMTCSEVNEGHRLPRGSMFLEL